MPCEGNWVDGMSHPSKRDVESQSSISAVKKAAGGLLLGMRLTLTLQMYKHDGIHGMDGRARGD